MSIGPPALGSILVQRLDALLGTRMAAHVTLVNGARPDAVAQPGESDRPGGVENATRGPRQAVRALENRGNGRQDAIDDAQGATTRATRALITRNDLTASAPTTLGVTARTILALLAKYPDAAPPVSAREPLWRPLAGPDNAQQVAAPKAQAGAPSPAALAQALRATLEQSGLFYESHLTQMLYGQRTARQLAVEPQAALPSPARDADASSQSAPRQAFAATTPNTLPETLPHSPPHTSSADTLPGVSRTPPPVHAAPAAAGVPLDADAPSSTQALAGLHPDATVLVRQQLDVLANQAFSWQGQPWPGADMQWQVEPDRDAPGAETQDRHWATRIALELPRLGQVEARLRLAGTQLMLQLVAPRSAAELSQHGDDLRQGMALAGLTLSQLAVDAAQPSPFVSTPSTP